MSDFIKKNWVFISGLISAIILVLQQVLMQPTIEVIPMLVALGIAILGYVANQWRGQGVTILGIIGILAYTFVQTYTTTNSLDWKQFIIMAIAAILSAIAPPPKGLSYEQNNQTAPPMQK